MLKIENLTKSYGNIKAIQNVDLNLEKGELVALVGPNGAGKSTLIKSIFGMLRPEKGEIYINNFKHQTIKAKNSIAYAPELPILYDLLTIKQHIEFVASAFNIDIDKNEIEEYLQKFNLKDKYNIVIKEFSKGMKQKTSLLLAFILNKPLLILDEPFSGIDPLGIRIIKDELIALKDKGKSILVSTHLLNEVKDLVDRFIIIDKGVIKADIKNKSFENIEKIFMDMTC